MPLHFVIAELGGIQPGETVVLTGAEAHHAAAVRRVRVDEKVTVGDGLGTWLTGRCTAVVRDEVRITVDSRRHVDRPAPTLTLVQALAKGDRDELAVQAATELGVDRIVPWEAARSVARWGTAKAEKGRARWAVIAREAAKQAHRAWIPEVEAPARTAGLAGLAGTRGLRMLVLEPTARCALSALTVDPEVSDVAVIVGPEGGIDPAERDMLVAAGATSVRLGAEVLRTSTAGPAAIAVLSVILNRW